MGRPIIASTFILIHLIDTVNEFKEKAQGWESYQDLSQCRFIKFIFLQNTPLDRCNGWIIRFPKYFTVFVTFAVCD